MRSLRNLLFGCGAFLLAAQLHAITPGEPPAVLPAAAEDNGSEDSPDAGTGANPTDASQSPAPANPANPYQAIIIRNAFGLKDPPPPPPPPQETNPPVNVGALKLTGITTLMGKRAMFSLNDGRTNILSDLVREGERDRSITNLEVLEIDAKARTVRVNYGGLDLKLDFVKNGILPPTNLVLAGGLPGLARPGMPGAPGLVINSPHVGFAPPTIQAGSSAFRAGVGSMPVRPTRLGNRGAGVGQGSAGMPQTQSAPGLTSEQQMILLREQERVAALQGIQLPPPPPVPGFGGGGPPALPGQP